MILKTKGDLEIKVIAIDSNTVEFEATFVQNGQRLLLQKHGLRKIPLGGILTIHNIDTEITVSEGFIKESVTG